MDSSLIVKLGNHKKTCAEKDNLSNLPDYLIDSIFDRLPIQDVVRTSILSRNWRYRWTTMSSMILDKHFSDKKVPNNDTDTDDGDGDGDGDDDDDYYYIYRDQFITITNQLFNFLKGPILKVHLHIPNGIRVSFQQLEQWILSLSRHRVRELVLTGSYRRDQLPSYLFHCSELRKLEVTRFTFKPPLECQEFLYLQHLSLTRISFECETVIKLPQLKKMYLDMCTLVYNLNIIAPKLKIIRVYFCYDVMFLRLLHNSQSLTTVHFSLSTPFPEIQKVNIMFSALCNLPDLASLSLDGYFLQSSIAENIPKSLSHAAKSLKTLTIFDLNFGDVYHLQSALCFLRNSPNLERLTVEAWAKARYYMHLDVNMRLDVKSALTYLEASDSFNQTLRRLKTIIITRVSGSRLLLLFVKLLLNHSPALEMISIRPTVKAAAAVHEYHNFVEDIKRFPRASSKAELLFLDPKAQTINNL